VNQINNLLCILTLSDADKFTIKYTTVIAQKLQVENIYINFINERQNIPDYVKHLYPGNALRLNQAIIKKIREDILTVYISEAKAKVRFNVFDTGNIHDKCQKFILENQIDLVIYRKTISDPDSISLAKKLARRSTCSVLILVDSFLTYNKILVPSDFSIYSKEAFDVAISWAIANNISRINFLHVVELSSLIYLYERKDYFTFVTTLKSYAAQEEKKFLQSCNSKGINISTNIELDDKIEHGINKVVQEKKIDLVIMGARGHSAGVSIFLGSISEELIKSLKVPILIVKRKGTGLHIMERIFSN
jgi:nucleotide-binding universal stress UspA family protein